VGHASRFSGLLHVKTSLTRVSSSGLKTGVDATTYIVYFVFLLHFLHTHLSHFASHVILGCICLIMLITVLG
jgi:hypothetical protein